MAENPSLHHLMTISVEKAQFHHSPPELHAVAPNSCQMEGRLIGIPDRCTVRSSLGYWTTMVKQRLLLRLITCERPYGSITTRPKG